MVVAGGVLELVAEPPPPDVAGGGVALPLEEPPLGSGSGGTSLVLDVLGGGVLVATVVSGALPFASNACTRASISRSTSASESSRGAASTLSPATDVVVASVPLLGRGFSAITGA